MFRDRSNLYLSYRRTFPHHDETFRTGASKFDSIEEEETLIGGGAVSGRLNKTNDIELSVLPPAFLDISDGIDEQIEEITSLINKLSSLYKKNLLPGFNDRTMDEEEIEKLNYSITTKFFKCDNLIKKYQNLKSDPLLKSDERNMIDNLQKGYALRIQQLSSNFRKIQNNYIKFLKKDEFDQSPSIKLKNDATTFNPALDETEELESYSREAIRESTSILQQSSSINDSLIRQREQEITKLAQGVLEVSRIFKEMQDLVIDQGTLLDRIDYNLENTKVDLRQTTVELNKATQYQKRTQKCKLIFLLTLIAFFLFLVVLLKPHRHGHDSQQPSKPIENAPSEDIPAKDKTTLDTTKDGDGVKFAEELDSAGDGVGLAEDLDAVGNFI